MISRKKFNSDFKMICPELRLQSRISRWTRLCLLSVMVGLVFLLGFGEPLAARSTTILMATNLIVTNLNDSGPGSLRQAIADAAPGATITFAVTGTITLSNGELVVNKNLTLSGPGPLSLSINGNRVNPALASRVINNSAQLTISGLTIRDGNAFAGVGGGILNTGVLTITNSVITSNFAQQGGGVFNRGQLQITDSTISANFTQLVDAGTDASGAGVYNAAPGGVAHINSSTISGNDVHDNGSGFFNGATATIANSTFSLNQAAGTAAVYNDKTGVLQLNNVTITINTGKKDATGLFAAGGTVTVANSLMSDNHTAGSAKTSLPDCGGPLSSAGHNLIGNATGCGISIGAGDQLGSNNAPLNAQLGPLQNNGGATSTHLPLTGSPAINAGDPAAPGSGGSACEATDQRGVHRPVAVACDIGAVEVGGALLSVRSSSPTSLGQATFFTATTTLSNASYQWNFGDGGSASGNPISHVYAAAGFYTATVTATANATTLTKTLVVSITNRAPVANAGAQQSVLLNALVTLDGSGSHDPDGDPFTYGWQQTEGMPVVLSSQTISQPTFSAPATAGVLTFTLTVTDGHGLASAQAQIRVFVGDVPVTSLHAENNSPTRLGQTTTFTVTASGSNVTYQWRFGDGSTAVGAVVQHDYSLSGFYTATVTATNNLNTITAILPVTVINPLPTLMSLNPVSLTAGSKAFTLTVGGQGFVSGASVQWNDSPRPTTFISPTQVTAALLAADVASAGPITITVVNPEPGGSASNPLHFTVNAPVILSQRFFLPLIRLAH